MATEIDIVELREEDEQGIAESASLKKYTDWNDKRNEERAKLEAEMERTIEFNVGHSLRTGWAAAQAKDGECLEIFQVLKSSSSEDGNNGGHARNDDQHDEENNNEDGNDEDTTHANSRS